MKNQISTAASRAVPHHHTSGRTSFQEAGHDHGVLLVELTRHVLDEDLDVNVSGEVDALGLFKVLQAIVEGLEAIVPSVEHDVVIRDLGLQGLDASGQGDDRADDLRWLIQATYF